MYACMLFLKEGLYQAMTNNKMLILLDPHKHSTVITAIRLVDLILLGEMQDAIEPSPTAVPVYIMQI